MTDAQDTVVERLVQELDEHADEQREHIRRVVAALGADQALALLDETREIEDTGGMPLPTGYGRRTPGGVFFALARRYLSPEQQQDIFGAYWRRVQRERQKAQAFLPTPPVADVVEESIPQLVRTLRRGEARTVKVTLIGKPGKVVQKRDAVLLTLENRKAPALPKGLPAPPSEPTVYTVYITTKHWRKVSESLKHPEDVLIIEGWQAYDPELEGIAVWGTNVTTKMLQQRQREDRAAE